MAICLFRANLNIYLSTDLLTCFAQLECFHTFHTHRFLAVAIAALITTKHIDLKRRDVVKLEEVPEQSSQSVE